jgi:hypothetical protein
MQDHLCQILAHYVVYLGSQLNLPIGGHVRQFILEAATSRWYKEGNFEWLNAKKMCFDNCPNLPANDIVQVSSQIDDQIPPLSISEATQETFDYWDARFSADSGDEILESWCFGNTHSVDDWSYGGM